MNYIFDDPKVRQAMQQIAQMAGSQPMGEALRLLKNTLNGGELAPNLGARFDQQRYQTGSWLCRNMIPLCQGGAMRRPGLVSFAASMAGDGYSRLVPFVFSARESRLLEFYQKPGGVGLRVWLNPSTHYDPALTIPWDASILEQVSFCQSADVIYCAHSSFPPGKLMRYADNDWRYQTINWLPQTPSPTIVSIASEGESSDKTQTTYAYVATAIDPETGQESMPSAIYTHTGKPLSSACHNVITINPLAGISEYRIYKKKGGVFGFIGRIVNGSSFDDLNISADTEDTPPGYRDPFADGNNPKLVFLHQQRLGFASSRNRPMTFWLSQAGAYESMAASIPPDADDAIEATLASSDASSISWAQSDRTGLAFGTEGGEWTLVAGEGGALTPGNLSFQPQTFYGSQPELPVLRAGSSLLYAQKGCNAIREYGYSFNEDRYQSNDLTLLARHLLRDEAITSWAWQPEPWGVVWISLQSGAFLGLTYLREHDVIAWHKHQSPGGQVMQLAVIPGFASQDTLVMLVRRENPDTGQCSCNLEYLDDSGNAALDAGSIPFSGIISPCLAEAQLENGSSWTVLKKINAIKCRVLDCYPFQARVVDQNHKPGEWKTVPAGRQQARADGIMDWACPVGAGFRENCRLELRLDSPGTILGLNVTCEIASQSGGQ